MTLLLKNLVHLDHSHINAVCFARIQGYIIVIMTMKT